jgi:UDP-N-acetylmuramate dehydrogenase
MYEAFVRQAEDQLGIAVEHGVSMKDYTTFAIGGAADMMAAPDRAAQIPALLALCRQEGVPFLLLGRGSNLLVSDQGIEGLVIYTGKLKKMKTEENRLYAECGASLRSVASKAQRCALSGLEFASGIPGSLGGAVFMNAGAYGGEMKQVVLRVDAADSEGNPLCLEKEECAFGYRSSIFSQKGFAVLGTWFLLEPGDAEEIKRTAAELNRRRREKQPLTLPSAGSVFKRPEGCFAGKLIEDCGLKGYCIGGAQVSEKHAGFIVNIGGASCEDVRRLVAYIQDTVWQAYHIRLESEIRLVGRR